ncbi:MAG: MarR family transcriptional regulator [Actinomycetota bacterium]
MGTSPTADELRSWERLLRFHRRTIARLDEQLRARADLGLDDYDVLHQLSLADDRRLRMGELAERMLIAPSSCSRIVDRLVRRGLVHRDRDPDDRRVVWASLSDEGRRRHRRAATTHVRGIGHLVTGPLDEGQLATLDAVLDRWERVEAPLP